MTELHFYKVHPVPNLGSDYDFELREAHGMT
jgi:hypothetical protein